MTKTVTQVILAGAGAVAALVLFSGAHLGDPVTHAASGPSGARFVNVDDNGDENFVNDNSQTSGDIFQQNAQDQSTA